MKIASQIFLLALALLPASAAANLDKQADQDNTILRLVLKLSSPAGGYIVVSPEANLSEQNPDISEDEIKSNKKFIYEGLRVSGDEVRQMIDRLYERNKTKVRLSLKSSPQDGFVVDYKGEYQKYFKKNGGGWDRWYKEHPKARGNTTVSLPVYNEASGLVLVYLGRQSHWLSGAGHVILYKYANGQLQELKRVMLWIS